MSSSFLAIAFSMSLLAFSFIAFPYIRSNSNMKGFAQLPLLAVVFVFVFAGGMYLAIGKPDATTYAPQHAATSRNIPQRNEFPAQKKNVGSVGSMIAGLAERLESEPDDTAGWILLAKSYQHLGQDDEARAAYAMATNQGGSDPKLEQSLSSTDNATVSAAEIRGRVSISTAAAAGLSDTDTVFIVAKAVGGSPMPLAVIRRNASDLPFDFKLDDESSMVPGMGLSSADKVVVSAKISRTGDALETEPGFAVESAAIDATSSEFLNLVFDPGSQAIEIQSAQADSDL